tara:strand:+ start:854 stop:1417 length:564 start_codon:yes stop_codon:yes gene_type:complete
LKKLNKLSETTGPKKVVVSRKICTGVTKKLFFINSKFKVSQMKSFFRLFPVTLTVLCVLHSIQSQARPKLDELEALMCKNYATSVLFSYFKLSKIRPSQSLIKPARKVAFNVIKKQGGIKDFLTASQCHLKVEEGASTFAYLKRIDNCLNTYVGKNPKESKPHKIKFEKAISEALREVNKFFTKGPL